MGKTLREFRRRVGEHLGDIRHNRDTPIARHVWIEHGGNPKCLQFKGSDTIRPSPRGGDIDRLILQRESFWIFWLQTVTPNGLNEQLNFICYT